jgi:putative transcriptional regulator
MTDVDAREVRRTLKMTQESFAERFGFPISTLRQWEQGRKRPDSAARVLLRVIALAPDVVDQAIGPR